VTAKSVSNSSTHKKLKLDFSAIEDDFFEDRICIGIVCGLPSYQFCHYLNKEFEMNFVREMELDIMTIKKSGEKNSNQTQEEIFFPVYQYCVPLSEQRYLLYSLKSNQQHLLKETNNIDFILLMQNIDLNNDVPEVINQLKQLPGVQLVQVLDMTKIKSKSILII
jgi:hypothetical protein